MIAEADLDGDGRINFHEFARLMQQQQQHQQQQQQHYHQVAILSNSFVTLLELLSCQDLPSWGIYYKTF